MLEAPSAAVAGWLLSDGFSAQLASMFPMAAMPGADAADAAEAALLHEATARDNCRDAFAAVASFESSHCLVLGNMELSYLQVRGCKGALVWGKLRARALQ